VRALDALAGLGIDRKDPSSVWDAACRYRARLQARVVMVFELGEEERRALLPVRRGP